MVVFLHPWVTAVVLKHEGCRSCNNAAPVHYYLDHLQFLDSLLISCGRSDIKEVCDGNVEEPRRVFGTHLEGGKDFRSNGGDLL